MAFCYWTLPSSATERIAVEIPTIVNAEFQYTGEEIFPEIIGYDPEAMTIGGDISATNPGSYTISFRLKRGYMWTDGKTGTRYIEWTIEIGSMEETGWKEISEASKAGIASSIWAVGDKKRVDLNGAAGSLEFKNETYYAYTIGFDHNAELEGENMIHLQFGAEGENHIAFCDSWYGGPIK